MPAQITHGKSRTAEYGIWAGMWTRCTNPNDQHYQWYGARGITVCERWRDFSNFHADMGDRPSASYSIERKDNNASYSKDNCKWATPREQSNNQSTTRWIEFAGERLTLSQWAQRTGLRVGALYVRLRSGWTPEEIITTPLSDRYRQGWITRRERLSA